MKEEEREQEEAEGGEESGERTRTGAVESGGIKAIGHIVSAAER
jgi:hypothetical protein